MLLKGLGRAYQPVLCRGDPGQVSQCQMAGGRTAQQLFEDNGPIARTLCAQANGSGTGDCTKQAPSAQSAAACLIPESVLGIGDVGKMGQKRFPGGGVRFRGSGAEQGRLWGREQVRRGEASLKVLKALSKALSLIHIYKKNTPDRLELNKYCPFCRKHTVHNETK